MSKEKGKEKLFDTETEDKYDEKKSLSIELGSLTQNLPEDKKMEAMKYLVDKEYSISRLKIIIGVIVLITGIVFFILGINDVINIEIEASGLVAKLVNCSPGALLVVIGFFIILKANIKIKK